VACSGIRDDGITLSGAFLCIPAAVLALLSVILNAPGYLAIALIVFPKIYRYSRSLLAKAYELPHITAARAADWAKCASWPGTCCRRRTADDCACRGHRQHRSRRQHSD